MELYLEFEIFFCYLEELGMEVILEKNSSPIWRSWKWSSISKKCLLLFGGAGNSHISKNNSSAICRS